MANIFNLFITLFEKKLFLIIIYYLNFYTFVPTVPIVSCLYLHHTVLLSKISIKRKKKRNEMQEIIKLVRKRTPVIQRISNEVT